MLSAEETYGNCLDFQQLLVFELAGEFHFSWTFSQLTLVGFCPKVRCSGKELHSLSGMSAGAVLGDFLGGSLFGRKGKGFPGCVAIELLTFWLPGSLPVFEA